MPDFSYFIFWFTAVWFVPPFFIWMIIVLLTTKQITPGMILHLSFSLPPYPFLYLCVFLSIHLSPFFPEMRRIPQYKFIIVGVLIMLNGVFILFSNPHVPGLMQGTREVMPSHFALVDLTVDLVMPSASWTIGSHHPHCNGIFFLAAQAAIFTLAGIASRG